MGLWVWAETANRINNQYHNISAYRNISRMFPNDSTPNKDVEMETHRVLWTHTWSHVNTSPCCTFHNPTHVPSNCAHTHTHTHCNTYTLHPKLAIILNPSPAWVIPDNPELILVNSGHSSAGFTLKPQRQGGDWSDHGDWGLGVALTGNNWSDSYWESRKTRMCYLFVFPRVFKTRPDWPLLRHAILVQNMFSPVCIM